MTDEEIIKKVIKGQQEYFSILVDRYKDRIYTMAYNYTNSSSEAEDLAQEAFVKIFKKLSYFNFKSKFSTWVYKVSMNVCVDWHRKNKKWKMIQLNQKPEYLLEGMDAQSLQVEEIVINNENREAFNKILMNLKAQYKFVIILYYCQGLSVVEISEILCLPQKTVYTRIRRGRQQLSDLINKHRMGVDDS